MMDIGNMTPEERFVYHFEGMYDASAEMGAGDPSSYARSKEIYAALKMGHTVAAKYAGPDAYNENGEPVEYKSTTQSALQGSYTGISMEPTWAKQWHYIKTQKIGCYKEHYMHRFEGGRLAESWILSGEDVCRILEPKIKRSWEGRQDKSKPKKDGRPAATLSQKEIKENGRCVYRNGTLTL